MLSEEQYDTILVVQILDFSLLYAYLFSVLLIFVSSHVFWLSYILYDPRSLRCNLYYCIDHLKEILSHLMQEEETVDIDVIKGFQRGYRLSSMKKRVHNRGW
ncbi:hypothetical protein H5410_047230 [Solanum commersonii]|uniref:Uncharacterized protein n=1 Tax=Solanum commersonii TaxID=4109 RepID=A0A9J5XHP5_SOLCO|nr:hypothetical protein H5410_047230 [Solanum commersonii]